MTISDEVRVRARDDAASAAAELGLRMVAALDAHQAHELLTVLNRVWGARHESGVMDLGSTVALAHSGNYVAQARVDGELVGGGVGFCGPPGAAFHSHVVGVLPTAAPKGSGRAIKLDQRAWCLDRGVTRMRWTYDPLVARNAYFNIRKLGALPVAYHEDFYGEMDDGINTGQHTDRMVVDWDLTRPLPTPVARSAAPAEHIPGSRAAGTPENPADDIPEVVALTATDDAPTRFTPPPADHDGTVLVGVPRDIEQVRRRDTDLAAEWRMATRDAFGTLLDSGWSVHDFRSGHYVFGREGQR